MFPDFRKFSSSAAALTPRQASRVFSWTRFMILLALLLILVGSMSGVLWANRRSGEAILKAQARDGLMQLVRVTGDNVGAYLQTALQIVSINRSLILSGQLDVSSSADVTLTFNTMLYAIKQLDGVLLGHTDGRFEYVRRSGSGLYIKVIERGGQNSSEVTQLDAENRVVSRVTAADPYDPRTRLWYKLALEKPGQSVWTPPYVFASSQLPGVTVATALIAPGGTRVVVGTDVRLSGLVQLLENLKLTPGGRAFITDSQGHAIATSRAWPRDVQGRVPTLKEVGDPALGALLTGGALLSLQKNAELTRRYSVGNEAYSAVLHRVEVQPGVYWVVGVYAPDRDFVSDLSGVARQQLILTAALILLTILVAWPLAFSATQPLAALQRQASTDALTGLRNRASFLAQLAEDLGRKTLSDTELGVAILDLDSFKAINDTFGHGVGDEVLQAFSTFLLAATLPGDTVGRLGGDEFALLLRGPNQAEVRLRLEGLLEQLALKPLEVRGVSRELRATAGLTFHVPQAAATHLARSREQLASHLLARADAALIGGKRLEKGRVWVGDEVER
ncbi:GGDEF domain-containing protein [Deinococcus psychrotolerans]|uniref:GGDEF domain-containing protein n=1 Tax=Deinococcus psychrotolerans TaxID=2489213 RepID=A0A3G8YNY1_9DEIO|nr:sensor domain-containing diguanylate cyclase [Deinococcus psychrotolerans]AZI42846.1 GGDEF domain-containing protein [Deinococcus psychrotolerans]